LLGNYPHPNYPTNTYLNIARTLWTSIQYIAGSSQNETPYEIVASLSSILHQWWNGEFAIITALLSEKNYHFFGSDPGNILQYVLDVNPPVELIQVALPSLYKHYPLYNVALYHELGHFVDLKFNISKFASMMYCSAFPLDHLMEYFADLFSAAYTGNSVTLFLTNALGDQPDSKSHPSTRKRRAVVESFLAGKDSTLISGLKQSVKLLVGKDFQIEYSLPNISNAFDNKRPITIKNDKELHGVIIAGWTYLINNMSNNSKSWGSIEEYESFKIINDLIEKSIRNYMIEVQWAKAK
jgi:hypothetical protein